MPQASASIETQTDYHDFCCTLQMCADRAIHLGRYVQVLPPERPLADGSMVLETWAQHGSVVQWCNKEHAESYQHLQTIIALWKSEGVTDYLLYGKDGEGSFRWEVVPYEKSGWGFLKPLLVFWKQLKVLWNITFGAFSFPSLFSGRLVKLYDKARELFSAAAITVVEKVKAVANGNDAFCKPEVVERQWVWKGRKVDILYNYAPIVLSKEKLHFLVVPKEHRETLAELSEEEYLEAMQLTKQLMEHYHEKGYHTTYLFNKNGREAGQTVPHWHLHVVFTATKTQELMGKLMVFKNMVLGYQPLSAQELQQRVEGFRRAFNQWSMSPTVS